MLILGIESSCDDTALALIEENNSNIKVIGSITSSQIPIHALFGGIVPELASREHARLIAPLFDKLLTECQIKLKQIDYIAVTRGPGLLGSLLVGVAFAKSLSLANNIPIIGINHLHAHLMVAGLENNLTFPSIGLLVSGGHTHLFAMHSPINMQVLGKTLDDAAGEAGDKFGKMLGLPYPGGAYLDKLGQLGQIHDIFPRPYIKNNNLDFSFSGLKTAGSAFLEANPSAVLPTLKIGEKYDELFFENAPQITKDGAASYLNAIAQTLKIKTERAIKSLVEQNIYPENLVVAGGVAANSFVQNTMAEFAKSHKIKLIIPKNQLCTDNGVMTAYHGLLLAKMGLKHDLKLTAIPRGKLIPNDYM